LEYEKCKIVNGDCWHDEEEKFSGKPRFRVPEVMLEEVLELIIRDFLT
jgi:hypothetical protein